METDLGHWVTKCEIPESPYGFIYIITNLTNNKKYIGKKQILTKRKSPPLKGKKNKRCKIVETDWKTYTSSSNEVNQDIETHGKDNFTFEIIRFCFSKFELAYFEAKLQFDNNVLLSENFYNGIINCRIGRAPKNLMVSNEIA